MIPAGMGVAAYPTRSSARYGYTPRQVAPPAPPKARWGAALLPYVLALLVLAAVAGYAFAWPQAKVHPSPKAPGAPGALVWGDGLFQKRVEMKAWLTLHGASYRSWAHSHPAAVSLIAPR